MPGLSGRACPGTPKKLALAWLPTPGGEAGPRSHLQLCSTPTLPHDFLLGRPSLQPKVSGAGIKYQPRKANIGSPLSSPGYVKRDKKLPAEGLAQQRERGWMRTGSPARWDEESGRWSNPDDPARGCLDQRPSSGAMKSCPLVRNECCSVPLFL